MTPVNKLNECGLSNTACSEHLLKNTKVHNTGLATEGLPGGTNKPVSILIIKMSG